MTNQFSFTPLILGAAGKDQGRAFRGNNKDSDSQESRRKRATKAATTEVRNGGLYLPVTG